uniref:DUF2470 domain-containing protein n=1 Tax=Chlamydomonas leiostraca TaxID=1034604 RepID=A0A7S0RU71_9CHLO
MQMQMHRSMGMRAPRLRALRPFTSVRPNAVANGNGIAHSNGTSQAPSPAETARTVVEMCSEGTLCTLAADGTPLGTAVSFTLDKTGCPHVNLAAGGLELKNLAKEARCSLQIQPTTYPARAVASVTLVGKLQGAGQQGGAMPMEVEKCLYFGGLDQTPVQGVEVGGDEFRAAESDALKSTAVELIRSWNDERAEDIYRIVSDFLKIPLTEMSYAELLWVDRLGMWVRVEAAGHGDGPHVVRVPFYRSVLDERDARSVITMAAQLAWENDRPYTPPVPSIFTDASATAAAANN